MNYVDVTQARYILVVLTFKIDVVVYVSEIVEEKIKVSSFSFFFLIDKIKIIKKENRSCFWNTVSENIEKEAPFQN